MYLEYTGLYNYSGSFITNSFIQENRHCQEGIAHTGWRILLLRIQPCNERYFVTGQQSKSWRLVLTLPESASIVVFLLMRQFTQDG
jgi:hypothetical protein